MYRLPRDIDEDPASLPNHGRANHLGAYEYRLDDRSMYAQQVSHEKEAWNITLTFRLSTRS